MAHGHVGEVLVRHGFYYGRRHVGASCLGVVAVIQVTLAPFSVRLPDVTVDTVEQVIGECLCVAARLAGGEQAVASLCGAD